ncbi:MAG: hypothetical protein WCC12_15255 [Anaerolineales bacterium]
MASKVKVYLEVGGKRTFAGALDWPGWCRSGKDETSALQALFEYGPRYARVLRNSRLGFKAPADASAFAVVERLKGNVTTDFGTPGLAPSADVRPVSSAELQRFQKLLKACWRTLDHTIEVAGGKTLRTGPRGGGRQLEGILEHILGGEAGYLGGVGWKFKPGDADDPQEQILQTRQAILAGLAASARGEIPARGPRGGIRWSPRYFVRRVAWHALDHAWEIEDRVLSS